MDSRQRQIGFAPLGPRQWARRLGRLSTPFTALAGIAIGLVAALALQQSGVGVWLTAPAAPPASSSPAISRDFPICGGGLRVTCVVDGDTFWLDGEKYRIADINTPETGEPECAVEAALGQNATRRLSELLAAGPFILAPADRERDRYGRKLRIVERDGHSIGTILVAEGLAQEWRGRRESWC